MSPSSPETEPVAAVEEPALLTGPDKPLRLSQEITLLLTSLTDEPVSLRQVIAIIRGRAYTMLLILLSLPFCLPIPVPGLSTALGAIIALIGLRLSLRLSPWLPNALLDARVSSSKVRFLLSASQRVARGMEVFLRPRLTFLVDFAVLHHLYGAMIFICGLLLLLPLPIPFSNLIPAVAVICLAAALIERDGVAIIVGIGMFIFTLAFFGGIFLGGAAVVNWLEDWFGGVFDPDETPPPELPIALPMPTDPAPQ